MKQYTAIARELLAECSAKVRKRENLTQDKMAEKLRITSRAYGDLERGKFCFSAVALLFLLLMLSDEEIKKVLEEFQKRVADSEPKGVA